MNTPAPNSFRGARAVSDVIARITPLANCLCAIRPLGTVLTVRPRDLDVLRRYPDAANALHNVVTSNGTTYWRNFELRADRFGKSSTRFEPPSC
jgi:hypothetical protein